jgi:putative phosphoesterase
MTFRIGIISDTHGLLRREAERRLAGVDHIIHAGDIGRPEIIDALREIAPVTAIRGNVDVGEWAREYPETKLVSLAKKSIYVLHDLKTLLFDPGDFDVSSPGIPTYRKSILWAAFSTSIPAARGGGDSNCPLRWQRSK